MGTFTLSISNPDKEASDYFRSLGSKTKPLNVVFSEIISHYRNTIGGQTTPTQPTAVIDTQSILADNQDLKKAIEIAEQTAAEQLTAIENQNREILRLTELAEQAKKVNPPSFIFTPGSDQLKQMQRFFALQRKKGLIDTNTANLPQSLTAKSITYFFKNEFPEVIK
jgi:hypothetical protein